MREEKRHILTLKDEDIFGRKFEEPLDSISSMHEGLGLKGVYTITRAKLVTKEQFRLSMMIEELQKMGRDVTELIRKLNRICKTDVFVFENLIPTVGRTMIANNLSNSSPTTVMLLNYTALGTGTTAVANGQTTLVTETYRKQTASYTNSSNIAYFTAFYSATETTGTYKEAGLFAGASGTANSGVLFSRVLLNPTAGITKSATETLTIDYTITIN